MNILPVFFAFFVCLDYFDLTLSQPQDEPAAQEIIQEVLKWQGLIQHAYFSFIVIAAASSGKNFIKQAEMPTEDCVRTARVIDLFTKPSTAKKTEKIMVSSAMMAINETTSSRNLADIYCKHLNTIAKGTSKFTIPDFEELKTKVELPKPAKNFTVEIPRGTSVIQYAQIGFALDDPQLLKLVLMETYLRSGGTSRNAILILSLRDPLKAIIDTEFARVRDDYVTELLKKNLHFTEKDGNPFADFLTKADEYFRGHSVLREAYKYLIPLESTQSFDWDTTMFPDEKNVTNTSELNVS